MISDKTKTFKYEYDPAIFYFVLLLVTGIGISFLVGRTDLPLIVTFIGAFYYLSIALFRWIKPQLVSLNDQIISAPKYLFFPFSSVQVHLKDITKVEGIGLEHEKCIKVYTQNKKLNIYINQIQPNDLEIFLNEFEHSLTAAFGNEVSFKEERSWLEKKRQNQKPRTVFLLLIVLYCLMQYSVLYEYHERQIQTELFFGFSLVISILICLFGMKMIQVTAKEKIKTLSVVFCLLSAFCISSVFSFFNQYNDHSFLSFNKQFRAKCL